MDSGNRRVKFCKICGKQLPEGSAAARKYCAECGKQHNIELTRIRQERRRKKSAEMREKNSQSEQKPTRMPTEQDRAYCRRCIYYGSYTEGYLCNHILMTGKPRGCRAGKGCEKRILEVQKKKPHMMEESNGI